MTKVYVTRTGAKYHSVHLCPGVVRAEIERGHEIDRWEVPLAGLSLEPCSVCWPDTRQWDVWTQLAHRVERTGDSPYEAQFVDKVLRHVPGLSPSDVSTQRKTEGRSGQTYFLDFVLQTSSGDRIAIEIDGKDKAPGERTIEQVQRAVEERRADLRAAGWRVLNLSNSRVVGHSAECVTEVQAELQDTIRPRQVSTVTTPTSDVDQRKPPPMVAASAQRSKGMWVAAIAVALLVVGGAWFAFGRSPSPEPGVSPDGRDCPSSMPVKGNINDSGEKIYHLPGWRYYDVTWPEKCFATAEDAQAADFRESESK